MNQDVHKILETYPDKVADLAEEASNLEENMEQTYSRRYLYYKNAFQSQGTKPMSVEDCKHHVLVDEEYQTARAEYLLAKHAYDRAYNSMINARKRAELIVRGL